MKAKVWTDGGGNTGTLCTAGAFIRLEDGREFDAAEKVGLTTNNVAEYRGLLLGIKHATHLGATHVEFFCDSQLIVNHIKGTYDCKNFELRALLLCVFDNAKVFDDVKINWVPRNENKRADALCREIRQSFENDFFRPHVLSKAEKRRKVRGSVLSSRPSLPQFPIPAEIIGREGVRSSSLRRKSASSPSSATSLLPSESPKAY